MGLHELPTKKVQVKKVPVKKVYKTAWIGKKDTDVFFKIKTNNNKKPLRIRTLAYVCSWHLNLKIN